MSLAAKAVLGWLFLFAAMFANGAARVTVLQPRLGEERARQAASLTGVVLVLAVSGLLVRASPGASTLQLSLVGASWLACTVAFEFLFGHFVSGLGWKALLADYDLVRGRLWPLVLISVCLGPWLWGAVRRARGRRDGGYPRGGTGDPQGRADR